MIRQNDCDHPREARRYYREAVEAFKHYFDSDGNECLDPDGSYATEPRIIIEHCVACAYSEERSIEEFRL